jgi:hypothetical protein
MVPSVSGPTDRRPYWNGDPIDGDPIQMASQYVPIRINTSQYVSIRLNKLGAPGSGALSQRRA